ncbi:MAG: hypothetical protein Q9163_002896 [Psora crenata]
MLRVRSALRIATVLPMPWSIAKELLLGLVLREILTYALHRYVLHGPGLRLAKWHKRWQHSMTAPFSFVAHYDHPLAYLVHVFLPMYIPAVLLRMHLLTYQIYLAIVSLEETFSHSGYNILPTAFILGGIARRHERHLMGNGEGNFGCFGLSDFVMRTSIGGDVVDDIADEVSEKGGVKKLKGRANSTKLRNTLASENGNDDDVGSAEEELLMSRRQNTGRNSKNSSERSRAPGDEMLKRKLRNVTKLGKGRVKRRSDDDE